MFDKKLMNSINLAEKEGNKIEKEKEDEIIAFIKNVTKILRFIDNKIIIHLTTFMDSRGMKDNIEFYQENGIRVIINKEDYLDEWNNDNIAPFVDSNGIEHYQKISIPTRKGTEIYLLRSGKLIEFSRSGQYHDENYNSIWDEEIILEKPKEISPLGIIQKYGLDRFEKEFLMHFKRAIDESIKKNPNKIPILKNIIDYFTQKKISEFS